MKINLKKIGSLLALCGLAASAHAAAFTPGNIVVMQYGDGSLTLSSTSAPMSVLEFLPSTASQSSPVQTIAIPTSGGSVMSGAGSATSEGFLTRSTNGGFVTFAGYAYAPGLPGIAASNSTAVSRCVGVLDFNGTFTRTATGSAMYSAVTIRSAVSDGINYWVSGSSGGEWYSANGGTPVQISSTAPGNARVARIFNGTLYVSSGSSPNVGINAFSGIPTSSTTSPTLIIPDGGTSPSPYDFAINPAGTVAYVADDRTFANAGSGIQKWTFNGSTWSQSFAFGSANGLTAGCRGLAVDFSGAHPVIYATTADSTTKLITITDNSAFGDTSDSADQATVLATAASTKLAFRGVSLAPSPVPVITSQPSDVNNVLSGNTVNLSVVADGAPTLTYHWYYPDLNHQLADGSSGYGGTISGSTTANLQLTSVAVAQAGGYQVIVANTSGSVTSRVAQVSIQAAPVPPTIDANITPAGSTNIVGDSVTFSVTAHGVPSVAYQWKFIPATNNLVTNILAGATSSSLPLSNLSTNQSGKYFVTITNSSGYLTTNSAVATLLVNPPPVVSIATLRSMVDPSTFVPTNTTGLFTTIGIVTTRTNLSTGGCEFYIQDSSGGICIYWSGAANSSLPSFGAQVQVTGQLAAFHNLLELEAFSSNPLESVAVLSTNNQPVAQPLPFDPNVVNTLATMQKLEGNYFVASNVTLAAGSTFVSTSLGEPITANASKVATYTTAAVTVAFTNTAGQTFVLYVNSYTDIPGQGKPAGPVTIYGVLGNYNNLFEFTPSRYADIISYVHVTNVLTHARKGDLATNSYTELVLRPGETLNTHVSIGDAAGGTVTLTALTDGLSANSGWSGLASGLAAVGDFAFSPTAADAGSNYLVNLHVTSTAGTDYTNTFSVYVPTADEQQMAITEILANPTTNPAAAFFDPLVRGESYNAGISTNDQYVEIANLSGTDWDGGSGTLFKLDTGTVSSPVFSSFDGNGADLPSGGALIVYGGSTTAPGVPNTAISRSLSLPTTSSGVLVFRNAGGNIVDRVVYAAGDLATNGSLTRFPTINDAFVPQSYVSTKHVTPGAQYDGGSWAAATSVPQGVSHVSVSVSNNQMFLNFTADTTKASTLWRADNLTDPFTVVNGGQFSSPAATFTETNLPSKRFYYITTQQ
jgi:hypothetical protein